jgi:2-amino-4-hydroxy-6-hydroxymethyldihydropteridine diphosphokinase
MSSPASIVAIGLGSNLGDRELALANAVRALRNVVAAVEVGGLYESAPLGGTAQPRFLNSALVGRTHVEPEPLLALLKFLELRAGRRRGPRWGPRALDLDLLLHGVCRRTTPELVLPHPEIRRRPFVLAPLNDVAPALRLPPDDTSVRSALDALGGSEGLARREWSSGAP